jgi:hypothetical protein
VDDQTLKTIIAAAQCAATSHFVQAYTVIRVRDSEKRQAIARLAGDQVWVDRAPVFLVFCADFKRLDAACRMHGTTVEKGWAEQFVTATVDTALLAQNVLLAAESLGMGGVFIGGIRNDPQTVCATCWRFPTRPIRRSACVWDGRPTTRPPNHDCRSMRSCLTTVTRKSTIGQCSMNTTGSPTIIT